MRKRQMFLFVGMAALLTVGPTIFFTQASPGVPASRQNLQPNAPNAIALQPVFSGLSNTIYLTNSQDGTNRLFVIEQVGRIRVAQPGASTTTVFLDITSRVLSTANEQGLLGLAFHPQYSINGRFFVYYTRQTDGALVIAEYRVSSDPNVGDFNSEIIILTIPHPGQTNHNGGTVAFGPDGYLYAGPGDGGGSNDPSNNAQNINSLLGKVLRIDIDTPNGPIPYSSPPTNPFFGATAGADEIYAYGFRNPYRYSFDRGSGQLWLGDVGQGAREEIDIVTLGGNYGWRVMEGTICNPAFNGGVCTPPAGSILPVFEYTTHSIAPGGGSRCAITGGFVYRGARLTVPVGAYLYADYCTGEIWQLLSGNNSLLLDTSSFLASFGEDEAGELYVVWRSGTVNRITASPSPPACSYALTSATQAFPATGGEGSLMLTTAGDCGWLAAATVNWITLDLTRGVGSGAFSFAVRDNTSANARTGTIRIGGQSLTIVQSGNSATSCLFELTPDFQSFNTLGGTGTISVGGAAHCAWNATSSASWITITSGNVGSGDGVVNFSVTSNTTGAARKGTITIGNQFFRIKQK